jgi:hypothetical protein
MSIVFFGRRFCELQMGLKWIHNYNIEPINENPHGFLISFWKTHIIVSKFFEPTLIHVRTPLISLHSLFISLGTLALLQSLLLLAQATYHLKSNVKG